MCKNQTLVSLYLWPVHIYPEKSLLIDEFERVRIRAAELCRGEAGRKEMIRLWPGSERDEIEYALLSTAEMRNLKSSGEPFPFDEYPDTEAALRLLAVENATLGSAQFMEIRLIASMYRLCHSFLKHRSLRFPFLWSQLELLEVDLMIEKKIDTALDERGAVRSTASTDLQKIRRLLLRKRQEADHIYRSVKNRYQKEGWLTDSAESWRNGRRVLSVFAEQKRMAKGIIHDLSATGKTCFLEPEEALQVNSELIALEEEEKSEILRILKALSAELRPFSGPLSDIYAKLAWLDTVQAKAGLAQLMDAHLPLIHEHAQSELIQARHPLLLLLLKSQNKSVVAFDLPLCKEDRILVISGPNAGGKTVCMKTVGLIQMMFQSGFLIPADSRSKLGIFSKLLVDIGDSQSLDFELSTYSSRLKNMKVFLELADANTLFLIDEFGTGTDPVLGGALAEAILEELNHRKSFGLITTHYMNLKVLADRSPGIINGSMAFDSHRLKPRFELEIGKPGSSYTFVVAERSGLPVPVIQKARKKVKRNSLLLEELLNKAEKEKANLRRLLEENRQKEKKLNELIHTTEEQIRKLDKMQLGSEERLKNQELRVLRKSEEEVKRFVKEYRDARNKKPVQIGRAHV